MKITIKEDFRKLKKGDIYDFSDIDKVKTITIVGNNGCGKSSIFQALRGKKDGLKNDSLYETEFKKLQFNIEVEHCYDKIFFYDSVKDSGFDLNNAYDASGYVSSGGFHAKDKSHGESSLVFLDIFLKKIKNEIGNSGKKSRIILDEFDKGFSLEFQKKTDTIINNIAFMYNVDIITITHSPILIHESKIVYDFEKRDFISSSKYLEEKIGLKFNKI